MMAHVPAPSKTRRFEVEIRDYESGLEPDPLTRARVERIFRRMLERDESDGIVIVREVESEAAGGVAK